MTMEVELDGLFRQNDTFNYEDYDYKDVESRDSSAVYLPVVYSLEMVLGLLGNGLLLAVLAQKRRSWRISDTIILHLSISDVLLLLLTLPIWAAQATQRCESCFSGFLCKISGAVFNINFYCGIFLLVCISLDRYLSIVHTIQLFSKNRPRLTHIICLLVWLGSLILSIPDWVSIMARRDYAQEKIMCVHKFSQSSDWHLLSRLPHHTLGFLLPAAALIICCFFILQRLQRSAKGLQKHRSIMVILPLIVVFFVCWAPYNITLIVDTFRGSPKEPEVENPGGAITGALIFTSALGCFHACLRPLLYVGLCQNFRKQTLALLRRTPVQCEGSLWELGVGEEVLPDQSHDKGETEQMTVDHQAQATQC